MRAFITTYKPGRYGETAKPNVMIKEMGEYAEFLLRAGAPRYGYNAVQDNRSGIVYLISDNPKLNAFEISFKD